MSEKKYLDKTGLTYVWSKIRGLIPTKTSDITNDSDYTTNASLQSVNNNIFDVLFSSASDFDATKSYAVGDYTVYQNKLYKCTVAHTGSWNASHFVQSSIFEE